MKSLILLSLVFSFQAQAKPKPRIYDAFMCYTQVDTVVLFGVLKRPGTMRINYFRLEQNPETVELKVDRYERTDNSIKATATYKGEQIVKLQSRGGFGKADINLKPFAGTEDVSFKDEDVLCYFGKFED